MTDHPVRAVAVFSTNLGFRLGLFDAHAPVLNTFSVLATVPVAATATVDLAAHVVNAALARTAVLIATARIDHIVVLNAAVRRLIAHLSARAGAIVPAGDALIIHRHTDAPLSINVLALGALGAVAVAAAADQAHPALIDLNAGQPVRARIPAATALADADAVKALRALVAVTVRSAARKRRLTDPLNTDLICGAIARLDTGCDATSRVHDARSCVGAAGQVGRAGRRTPNQQITCR